MSREYYDLVGRPNDMSISEPIPRGFPIARVMGIINDINMNPVNGLLARNNIVWTPPTKLLVLGILLWIPPDEVTGSGTPPTVSIGKGSSLTNLMPASPLLMEAEDEFDSRLGAGLCITIDSSEQLNVRVTSAASGFTKYNFVPLLFGMKVSRG